MNLFSVCGAQVVKLTAASFFFFLLQGRAQPLGNYGVPRDVWQQLEEEDPRVVAARMRKRILRGVQVLISDEAASPDYTLIQVFCLCCFCCFL